MFVCLKAFCFITCIITWVKLIHQWISVSSLEIMTRCSTRHVHFLIWLPRYVAFMTCYSRKVHSIHVCMCFFAHFIGTALSEFRYKPSNVHNKGLSVCINDWGAILVLWCSCHVCLSMSSFVVSRFFGDMPHKIISKYLANYIGTARNVTWHSCMYLMRDVFCIDKLFIVTLPCTCTIMIVNVFCVMFWVLNICICACVVSVTRTFVCNVKLSARYGLSIFIDIQTSKTLIQMDINKMMRMEFIQWRVNTYS